MRPEPNAKHEIKYLKRRKILIDALIAFIRTHPNISSDAVLRPLQQEWSVFLRHSHNQTSVSEGQARLEKYTEDWSYRDHEYDQFDTSKRMVCEDVSEMSEEDLVEIIEKLDRELHSDDED